MPNQAASRPVWTVAEMVETSDPDTYRFVDQIAPVNEMAAAEAIAVRLRAENPGKRYVVVQVEGD